MKYCNENDIKRAGIGVFDSGIGGITTLAELIKRMPDEKFLYFADKAGAPYGSKSTEYVLSRTKFACAELLSRGVKAIVLACNTATNVGISDLRADGLRDFVYCAHPKDGALYSRRCIFVGLEPAVKPAFMQTNEGNILVLLTPSTARQDKFKNLIRDFDHRRLIISPQPELAEMVEKNILSLERIESHVHKLLSSYKNVSAVVLGCTHYVYLREMIRRYYGNNIKIFDGNSGVASRLSKLLDEQNLATDICFGGSVEFLKSSNNGNVID